MAVKVCRALSIGAMLSFCWWAITGVGWWAPVIHETDPMGIRILALMAIHCFALVSWPIAVETQGKK